MGDTLLIIAFMVVIGLAALEIRNIFIWINNKKEKDRAFEKWWHDVYRK